MILRVNYNRVSFNGYIQKAGECRGRSPMERAIAEIGLKTKAKIEYVKRIYSGSSLVLSDVINSICEKSAEEIEAVRRKFMEKPEKFRKSF